MQRTTETRGFTIVELTFVTLIVGVLALLMGQSIATLSRTHSYSRGQVRITDVSDAIAQVVTRDVGVSVRVFAADDAGDAYAAALDMGTAAPITGSRRPTFTNVGYFEPDLPTESSTGNMLLLGIREEPTTIVVRTVGAPDEGYRVDVLRFVCYFPTPVAKSRAFDLARWGSVKIARLSDVMALSDALKRTKVIKGLAAVGIQYAWEPTQDRANGLFKLTTSGGAVLLSATERIPGDPAATRLSLAGTRRVGVASNDLLPQPRVPFYANANRANGALFPGGFEIRIDGPSSGRLLLLRMVLVSSNEQGAWNHAEVRRLLSCHDG